MILSFSQVISFGPNYKDEVSKAFKSEKEMRNILGGKGANLGGMSALGLSVPPGFTITTEVCAGYQYAKGRLSESIWRSVLRALKSLENDVGRKFGDAESKLLFLFPCVPEQPSPCPECSTRSSTSASMMHPLKDSAVNLANDLLW